MFFPFHFCKRTKQKRSMFKLRLVVEPLGVSIVVPRNQKQNKNKQECVLYSYRGCTRARIYSTSSLPPKKKIFVAALSGLAFDCFSFRVSLRSRCLHVFYLNGKIRRVPRCSGFTLAKKRWLVNFSMFKWYCSYGRKFEFLKRSLPPTALNKKLENECTLKLFCVALLFDHFRNELS